MASLSFTLATPTTSSSPFFSQTTTKQRRLMKTHGKQTHRFQVSCNVSSNNHEKPLPKNPQPQKLILPQTSLDLQNVDRRNLLLGLGGVYSTATLSGLPPAFAEAIKAPFNQPDRPCKDAVSGFDINKKLLRPIDCCPLSKNGPESHFKFPDKSSKTRIRYPLHKLPVGYLDKYMDAIQKMKDLPDSDPRSFNNQAKVHCAYCNGSYTQNGQELQIHNSWLFFPFHRWYLYFYERILGDLIGDSTFGLPYWNWDNPEGMTIPHFFVEKQCNNYKVKNGENPLYDEYRDASHLRYEMIDLDYSGRNRDLCYDQKEINLATMNRQMMRNAFDATSFFGGKYVAGDEPIPRGDNVVGSVEAGCHTAVHRWVGNPTNGNKEDMGNFYSAGYDPLFYVHHSNVDRMWTLWKQMGGKEPTDTDWENASYVFYDEKQNPVRVYNKQSVDLSNLKYEYHSSATPWTDRPPRSRCNRPGYPKRNNTKDFPYQKDPPEALTLTDSTVRLRVKRPPASKNRNAEQKKSEKEILCLIGISFDCTEAAKFDVFVNDCDEEQITPCDSENVGSFAAVPHAKGMAMGCKSGMRFSLTELLEETKAEGDESIRVTIVPRPTPGKKVKVTIDAIEIRLIPVLEK
ncbi:hypothetical protein Lser_V15G45498 [Lactuca serriola]